jgi:tetratricopeptide (TPR) repeat protein
MMRLISIYLFLCCSIAFAQDLPSTPKSPRQAIVVGQQLVDAGELETALPYLEQASQLFPENDTVWAMYGQALYEGKEIQKAENAFRRALVINPLNKVAKSYVEDIRETSAASVSLEYQQMQEVAFDKAGDILVLALGFLLASATGGILAKFASRRIVKKARRHFLDGQYDEFSDLLEIQLSKNELKALRASLEFMLENKDLDEAIDVLNTYVNDEGNLATFIRMIKLAAHRKNDEMHKTSSVA